MRTALEAMGYFVLDLGFCEHADLYARPNLLIEVKTYSGHRPKPRISRQQAELRSRWLVNPGARWATVLIHLSRDGNATRGDAVDVKLEPSDPMTEAFLEEAVGTVAAGHPFPFNPMKAVSPPGTVLP